MRLLLLDIDGTIVGVGSELGKLHHMAFIEGFRDVYGLDARYGTADYSGRTDMFIVDDILRKNGFDEEEIDAKRGRMFMAMERHFRDGVAGGGHYGDSMISGAAEALGMLSRDGGNALGLLTGNIEPIALMKMEALGIRHYFRFGGYGDSSERRSDLIGIAIDNALRAGVARNVGMRQVYVVGDTRHDIECAREKGAVAVAVATGTFSKEDLVAYAPEYLLGGLSELESAIGADGVA